ncbi:hypothetical protein Anapl_06622 [Anas platyrhynchos]|uniref:Uncharacterized protein n=1 Tax=Anas platyrhynchos TaxID=8839 RepID=R0KC47_ANAPL|nr:hypothetical protein Anapl_06622 [Anas platyrhynchos]
MNAVWQLPECGPRPAPIPVLHHQESPVASSATSSQGSCDPKAGGRCLDALGINVRIWILSLKSRVALRIGPQVGSQLHCCNVLHLAELRPRLACKGVGSELVYACCVEVQLYGKFSRAAEGNCTSQHSYGCFLCVGFVQEARFSKQTANGKNKLEGTGAGCAGSEQSWSREFAVEVFQGLQRLWLCELRARFVRGHEALQKCGELRAFQGWSEGLLPLRLLKSLFIKNAAVNSVFRSCFQSE